MTKILKVKFEDGNQTLDVNTNLKIIASLFTDLNGAILLCETNDVVVPEVVNAPLETTLENTNV